MKDPDVTILGAGIFGLSIAWSCVKMGARVQIIDPNGPGAGASGGIVGALAPHVPENWNYKKAFQLESLLMAQTFWSEVEAVSGLSSGYARTGRLQPIVDDHALALARSRVETSSTFWKDEAVWEVIPASSDGWVPHSPTGYVIHDTLSARLLPRQACLALASALKTCGADVRRFGEPMGKILHATGVAGLNALSKATGQLVGNGVKGQGALFEFSAPDAPQLFVDALHIIPHADGTTAVGSTSEREYTDATSTDHLLEGLIDQAREIVPALKTAPVIERWAGVRPRARSRAPMLGEHPLNPGEFIANGGFKIGFGMAPKAGQVMADLVLNGQDEIPSDFRPEASLSRY